MKSRDEWKIKTSYQISINVIWSPLSVMNKKELKKHLLKHDNNPNIDQQIDSVVYKW